MNHAPLLARVPFCFQARKWCPPVAGLVAVQVNGGITLRTGETFPAGPHDREIVLSSQKMLLLLVVAVSKVCIVLVP
jgi:hypothetical protein